MRQESCNLRRALMLEQVRQVERAWKELRAQLDRCPACDPVHNLRRTLDGIAFAVDTFRPHVQGMVDDAFRWER